VREVEELKDPQVVKVEEPVAMEDVVVIILKHFLDEIRPFKHVHCTLYN
jgi:hypothetical protein